MKKKLDDSKILFVIVCNDKAESERQVELITKSNLTIPQGCSCSVHVIIGKKNLARAFNAVQKNDNSKYKIYLTEAANQLSNSLMLKTVEAFFLEPKTGFVGLIGSEIPTDGDYTQAKNFYGLYTYKDENNEIQNYLGKDPLYYQSVHMVESSFFATNEDFSWDERVGDDFVVAAQCLNFRNKGYDVGVAYQEKPFVIFEKDSFSYNPKTDIQEYMKQLEKFHLSYRKKIQPLVSILIPTYNQPKFCQEALESALNQTYQNIEILVGDDSTNDETKKMIRPYLKKYPNLKYFYHDGKIPRGGGPNMAFLLNRCFGEYVNYLLHDDLFHPEKINKMMQYFVTDLENDIGLVTSARSKIDENGKFIRRQNPWQPRSDAIIKGEDVGRRLLFIIANFIGELTTVLFKKRDVTVKNFQPGADRFSIGNFCGVYSMSYGDMDTWLNILKSGGNLIFMSEPLSAFRKHAAQNTYNPNTRISLPLDALNFITLAWLNNVFFRNVEEFYFCLDKWPLLADRWFRPIEKDDSEIIKKRKEWILKLKNIFADKDYAKMTDAAISYLLDYLPGYAPINSLIKKNPHKNLWEKNDSVFFETKNLDLCENFWIAYGALKINNKQLIFDGVSHITCSKPFKLGSNSFTVEMWAKVPAATSYNTIMTLAFNHFNRLRICTCDDNSGKIRFLVASSSMTTESSPLYGGDSVAFPNQKVHLSTDYDGSTIYFFANGILIRKFVVVLDSVDYFISIGAERDGTYAVKASISAFRFSSGICRHITNFIPDENFKLDENTLSLLNFE